MTPREYYPKKQIDLYVKPMDYITREKVNDGSKLNGILSLIVTIIGIVGLLLLGRIIYKETVVYVEQGQIAYKNDSTIVEGPSYIFSLNDPVYIVDQEGYIEDKVKLMCDDGMNVHVDFILKYNIDTSNVKIIAKLQSNKHIKDYVTFLARVNLNEIARDYSIIDIYCDRRMEYCDKVSDCIIKKSKDYLDVGLITIRDFYLEPNESAYLDSVFAHRDSIDMARRMDILKNGSRVDKDILIAEALLGEAVRRNLVKAKMKEAREAIKKAELDRDKYTAKVKAKVIDSMVKADPLHINKMMNIVEKD